MPSAAKKIPLGQQRKPGREIYIDGILETMIADKIFLNTFCHSDFWLFLGL